MRWKMICRSPSKVGRRSEATLSSLSLSAGREALELVRVNIQGCAVIKAPIFSYGSIPLGDKIVYRRNVPPGSLGSESHN